MPAPRPSTASRMALYLSLGMVLSACSSSRIVTETSWTPFLAAEVDHDARYIRAIEMKNGREIVPLFLSRPSVTISGIEIVDDWGISTSVVASEIVRIDIDKPRRSGRNAWRGLLIGLAGGALLGYVTDRCRWEVEGDCDQRLQKRLVRSTLTSGAIGAMVGSQFGKGVTIVYRFR